MNLHEQLPPDADGYPEMWPETDLEHIVSNAFAIGMLQADSEALEFAAFVRDVIRPVNIVELGTLCGGMMYLLDRMSQPGKRISVDRPWTERDPKIKWGPALFERQVPGVVTIEGDIHNTTVRGAVAQALAGEPADLMFVDADHSKEGGRRHWDMYHNLVRPGGWYAMHDIANHWPCQLFYEEIRDSYQHQEFIGPLEARFGIGAIQIP